MRDYGKQLQESVERNRKEKKVEAEGEIFVGSRA
jgi:hypothetical protein